MSDNVLIAIIAASAIVLGAVATSLVAVVAIVTSNKRLDKIDARLNLIEQDLKEFFKDITRIKLHVKMDG